MTNISIEVTLQLHGYVAKLGSLLGSFFIRVPHKNLDLERDPTLEHIRTGIETIVPIGAAEIGPT